MTGRRVVDLGRHGSALEALGRARAARERVLSGAELALVHTRIAGPPVQVLGRFQRAERALHQPVFRETGGPPWVLGEGVQFVRVALAHASVLMSTPKDKILNRNVRPLLGALRACGIHAMYGGRDFVLADGEIVALIAWARGAAGEVVLDIALPASDSTLLDLTSQPGTPWYHGKRVRRVHAHGGPASGADGQPDIGAAMARAFAPDAESVTFASSALPAPRWTSSAPAHATAAVAIGSATAVIEPDRASVSGDFFADDALEALDVPLGAAIARGATEEELAQLFAAIVIEGVRDPARSFAHLLAGPPRSR